jgi:hypothetical protein
MSPKALPQKLVAFVALVVTPAGRDLFEVLARVGENNGSARFRLIRRECLDHMIVFREAHLRQILRGYAAYYNVSRTHRSLNKDAPLHRATERLGAVVSRPVLDGLHHQYCRT